MNMDHMNFIDKVALNDTTTLRLKETTYQGSWKRRGGVGAFMMLARKWDRLENMLRGVHFDVFQAIEKEPGGADGTVLAEIRDLRQYLVLVEAEMMARNQVLLETKRRESNEAVAKRGVDIVDRRVPRYEPLGPVPGDEKPGTPEDGGQHASIAPWVVGREYFMRKEISKEFEDKFWNHRAPKIYVLEPFVQNFSLPRPLQGLYKMRGETWTLDISRCPADVRDYFPNLQLEQNMKEWDGLAEWCRVLYTWDDTEAKYRLADINRAWHVETE